MQVEIFTGQADNGWLLLEISQPESSLEISSIHFLILFKDIYQSVTFED